MYRSVVVQCNESGQLRLRRNEESGEGPIQVIHTALPLVTCVLYCQAVLTEVSLVAANIGYFSVLPLGTINSSSTLALVEPPLC